MVDCSMEYYRADLAAIHDEGYGLIAREAGARLLRELARRRVGAGLIVDLGCGSGALAEIVSEAGFDVYGVDISAAMIDIARRRAPRAQFVCAPLLGAAIPPCIAVTATGECLNYLFDPRSTVSELSHLFQRIFAALDPGGVLLFDMLSPDRRKALPAQRFAITEEWATLVEVDQQTEPGLLERRITTFRRDGPVYRREERCAAPDSGFGTSQGTGSVRFLRERSGSSLASRRRERPVPI
jgi:SAM-dependent methyltransferase